MHAQRLQGCRKFGIMLESNQCGLSFCCCLKHWDLQTFGMKNKIAYYLSYLATLNQFYERRIVVLGFLRLYIQAIHDIPEFLNASLLSMHLIDLDIDWSWNTFTLHNFCCFAQDSIWNMHFCAYFIFLLRELMLEYWHVFQSTKKMMTGEQFCKMHSKHWRSCW